MHLTVSEEGRHAVVLWRGELDETPWGKSRGLVEPYGLVRHLLDAAAMAEALWDVYLTEGQRRVIASGLGLGGDEARARGVVAFWAALHDVGKLSVGFQASDAAGWERLSAVLAEDAGAAGVERIGHARAGMECVPGLLGELGYEDAGRECALWRVAEVVGGHHGRYQVLERERARDAHFRQLLGGAAWDAERGRYVRAVHALLGSPAAPGECSVPCAVLVTGVVILADWLVSQESYLRERQADLASSLEKHLAQARTCAPGVLAEAGLVPVELARRGFEEAHGIAVPNPLQRSLIEQLPEAAVAHGPGLVLVTAATGDGKTEAALEAERILSEVGGSRGIGFLLPTMATSDRMYERVSRYVTRQADRSVAGGASVTLTHSMAWLSSAYAPDDAHDGPGVLSCEDDAAPGAAGSVRVVPKRWLRGGKRPLLAQFAVGTIDQALLAVLPVRHNALRILGLSGKTVIIDEAHAYDPYMQVLLGRLLRWLAAYSCSVVLLSATLPASVSDRLIKEYLKGAGTRRRRALRGCSFRAPYPGWVFVPAALGEDGSPVQVPISGEMQRAQERERHSTLLVRQRAVRHTGSDGEWERGGTRMAVVKGELEPLLGPGGGSALVVCTTVDDAQRTYLALRDHLTSRGLPVEEITLLHARMPGEDREERAETISTQLGRKGPRPHRRIVVATQVVEQSLDLDADLVVSDLAPLALLLQRAGRCWRHEGWWAAHGRPDGPGRERPAWARAGHGGPQLVVLDPLLEGGAVPKHWGEVYHKHLLHETSQALLARGARPIDVPGEVQELVEQVHGDRPDRFHWDDPEQSAGWSAYQGQTLAMETAGRNVVIPDPENVLGLHELHQLEQEEWEATTRLGADSVRVLCVYQRPGDAQLTLDEAGNEQLPIPEQGKRLPPDDVRRIMRRTIPVRSTWLGETNEDQQPPDAWSDHPLLADLMLLRHEVSGDEVRGARIGGKEYRLDQDLGLERR